jgi:hypothetical protein
VFSAEISDASGNFPGTVIGIRNATTGGTITAAIPAGFTPGTLYRIRVTSTLPAVTGPDNGTDIKISAKTTLAQYVYLQTGMAYTPLNGNTNVPVAVGTLDDGMSAPINIGFNFNFGGINFTQLKMNTNGWLTFNLSSVSTNIYAAINSAETFIISGFSANLLLSGTKPMSYKLTGTAPNRVLILQWQNITHVPNSPGTGSLTGGEFQILLYETLNIFEINYGTFSTTAVANFGSYAQVGWKGECPADAGALYKSSYPYWDTPSTLIGNYLVSLSFGYSGGFYFLPYPGEMFRYTPTPNPLPVTLLSFTGEFKNNHIYLKWVTASEINNDYFDIESSRDGAVFNAIGQVMGHGNSTQLNNYDFEDHASESDVSYYRLKQVDYDGNFEYSEVIFIKRPHEKTACLVYPSGENGVFLVSCPGIPNNTISVYDTKGKLLEQINSNLNYDSVRIDLTRFSNGLFILNINNGVENENLKLIKY